MKKQFLFILALAAVTLAGCAQAQKKDGAEESGKPKENKNIYLQLYSVRDDIKADFKGTIQKVAEMGYTGVEAAGYADGKFYNLEPEEFKKEIEAAGMTVLSSHAGRPLEQDISKTNWEEVWKWWDQAIAAHKAAGMKFLVVAWIPTPKTIADLQSYCDYFNQIGEKCNAAGISFGYHNHNFEFQEIEGQLMYDYLLKNTDPSKVFFEMDVYWTVRGGKGPVYYFDDYPKRFKLLHIKDEKELGRSGMIGFDAIFNNLATAGAEHVVVEVERYSYTPLESVKLSRDYLIDSPFVKAGDLK